MKGNLLIQLENHREFATMWQEQPKDTSNEMLSKMVTRLEQLSTIHADMILEYSAKLQKEERVAEHVIFGIGLVSQVSDFNHFLENGQKSTFREVDICAHNILVAIEAIEDIESGGASFG